MASAIRLEHFGSNTTKASCLLAVRRMGTRDQRVDWLRIETWGKLAETFDRYCGKGSRVGVKGRLRGEFYNRDGGTRGGDLRRYRSRSAGSSPPSAPVTRSWSTKTST